ncbi:hypothetical protein [Pseudolactococcus insecticola]|uniref:Uncharacterized protein n=1 Tax=Pseudolactococcus insecticola TaxID=2709158 RepID=A0A6A0B5P0_9LACT|nr:hypothetical protein [Lactococcus insecticola]GFH40710.1 hypothetical protein Hs20B_11080 [Lactococcus insecticola]
MTMKDGTVGTILEVFDDKEIMIDVEVGEDYEQLTVKISDIKLIEEIN